MSARRYDVYVKYKNGDWKLYAPHELKAGAHFWAEAARDAGFEKVSIRKCTKIRA